MSNIHSVEFVSKIGTRTLRHGGLQVKFKFTPRNFAEATGQIDRLMTKHSLERGKDYHIPPWNTWGAGWTVDDRLVKDTVYLTFNDDMTFVMTKMGWDDVV